ncbi:MAG: GntR family transcriptional regulator [Aliihoeflea sp.]
MATLDCFGGIKTSAEYAYRRLEQMVVTLELKPGSMTTEAELQEQVGVGRTPVREAIQRLTWDGLLEIRPRSGVRIVPLEGHDWMQIMVVRRNVEVVLARTAAQNCTPEARRMLEKATDLMNQAASDGSMEAFVAADKMFDIAVAQAAGNCHLMRAAFPLQTHTRRFWMHYYGLTHVESGLKGHLRLAEAIMAKDVPRAVREVRTLMSHVQSEASHVLHQDEVFAGTRLDSSF